MASTDEQRAKWREQYRKRYKANPDYFKQRASRYYEDNRDRALENMRSYREANPDRVRESIRRWNADHTDRRRDLYLQRHYGITKAEFDTMESEQGGVCSICGKSDPVRLAVDHDRNTGQVRGLLCRWCNRFLGFFDHDSARMRKAADYLDRHGSQPTPQVEPGVLRRRRIVEDWVAGLQQKQIAKTHAISRSRVQQILNSEARRYCRSAYGKSISYVAAPNESWASWLRKNYKPGATQ